MFHGAGALEQVKLTVYRDTEVLAKETEDRSREPTHFVVAFGYSMNFTTILLFEFPWAVNWLPLEGSTVGRSGWHSSFFNNSAFKVQLVRKNEMHRKAFHASSAIPTSLLHFFHPPRRFKRSLVQALSQLESVQRSFKRQHPPNRPLHSELREALSFLLSRLPARSFPHLSIPSSFLTLTPFTGQHW